MHRIIVYIDGFNLYYGLRASGLKQFYWLDLRQMAERLLLGNQTLARVRYFTARVRSTISNPGKRERQNTYLEALETLPDLEIHYGRFISKEAHCRTCGATWTTYEEKMTDVNIAVELLGDAQDDAFDTAIIVSGDGDLSGLVQAVRGRYPHKRLLIAFPPRRHSADLHSAATASFNIGRDVLRDSQFPERVVKPDGYTLTRPANWR